MSHTDSATSRCFALHADHSRSHSMYQSVHRGCDLFRHTLLLVLSPILLQAFSAAAFAALLPEPVHRWSFTGNTLDTGTVGGASGTLNNGAAVVGNRLQLDGSNDYMLTSGISTPITTKTLVSWVSLSTLAQAAGSALTLQHTGGGQFDGIIYGERTANQWMNGSNGFTRSNGANNGGALETVTEPGQVMMAITYSSASLLSIYRDGVPYASYNPGSLLAHPGTSEALFGYRHANIGPPLGGFINEARIYDSALSAAEIQSLYLIGPDLTQVPPIPAPEPSSLLLLGLGTCLLSKKRRRSAQQAAPQLA
jgi:hypothetical protein